MRILTLLTIVLLATPALATPDPVVPHYTKDDHSVLVMAKNLYGQVHSDKITVIEPVCFDWTNTDHEWHYLPSTDPWHIEDKDGDHVYGPIAADVIVDAPPGYSHASCWFQRDSERHLVPGGTYTLVFRYDTNDIRLTFQVAESHVGPQRTDADPLTLPQHVPERLQDEPLLGV